MEVDGACAKSQGGSRTAFDTMEMNPLIGMLRMWVPNSWHLGYVMPILMSHLAVAPHDSDSFYQRSTFPFLRTNLVCFCRHLQLNYTSSQLGQLRNSPQYILNDTILIDI